jgi:anti-anti-sigma factor
MLRGKEFIFPPLRIPAIHNSVEIRKSEEQGATLLALEGEIDLHASPRLREALQEIAESKAEVLLVDFSDVKYIDSSGLATLVEYVRESKAFNGRLALFGLQPKVKMVFELVRLNELFTIADTKENALAALSAG